MNRDAVVVGPVALLYPGGYEDAPWSMFARHGAGYYAQKILVVVKRGAVVTVAVEAAARGRTSLLYDPSSFRDSGTYRVSDGVAVVSFRACEKGFGPAGDTQFNGGFVVAGHRCVSLQIWIEDNPTPRRVTLSFGVGRCGS